MLYNKGAICPLLYNKEVIPLSKKKIKKLYKWIKPCCQSACHTAIGVLSSAVLIDNVNWQFVLSTTTLSFLVAVLTKYSTGTVDVKKEV